MASSRTEVVLRPRFEGKIILTRNRAWSWKCTCISLSLLYPALPIAQSPTALPACIMAYSCASHISYICRLTKLPCGRVPSRVILYSTRAQPIYNIWRPFFSGKVCHNYSRRCVLTIGLLCLCSDKSFGWHLLPFCWLECCICIFMLFRPFSHIIITLPSLLL
jgi:hypothetical protein